MKDGTVSGRALRLGLAAATLAASTPAAAQDDVQAWGATLAQGPIAGDLVFWAEVQTRFTDDAARLGQLLIRPAVGVRLAPDTSAHIGYAYIRTDPAGGAATDEHRAWQQLIFPILRNARGLYVSGRSRVEQRRLVGRDDTGWRLRQFVRAQIPLKRGGPVSAVVFTEGFYAANATDWGAPAGIDQWRTFVGVSLPASKRLTIEPGYLNQTVFRRGTNAINHVASVNLFLRF